ESGEIESVSFLFRLALMNYERTGWMPPLSDLLPWSNPKVDYSFRIEKESLHF
ncbi:16842_t:CDS:1, partial [Cetraspora pellucida]